MATVQIKREDLKDVTDFKSFLAKLNELFDGKWVGLLSNGEVIADEKVEKLHEIATKKKTNVSFMFHASKKGELLL